MAEISPDQVKTLLVATEQWQQAADVAAAARDNLDQTLLRVAREAKVGLRELTAVTGLHPQTIRAGIQRAAGPATIDYEQPELDLSGIGDPGAAAADPAFPVPAQAAVKARPAGDVEQASTPPRVSGRADARER